MAPKAAPKTEPKEEEEEEEEEEEAPGLSAMQSFMALAREMAAEEAGDASTQPLGAEWMRRSRSRSPPPPGSDEAARAAWEALDAEQPGAAAAGSEVANFFHWFFLIFSSCGVQPQISFLCSRVCFLRCLTAKYVHIYRSAAPYRIILG